ARRRILQIHTRGWQRRLSSDVESEIVERTQGWGGADIGALCTEAVLAAIRRSVPQIYDSTQKLAIDARQIVVTPGDVFRSLAAVAPSTQRSGAAGTAALPRALRALLERYETRAVAQLGSALSLGANGRAEPGAAPVFRPRVAVFGISGMGVPAVGAAAAHAMEAHDVPVFVLSALAMHADAATPPCALIARVFSEARRRQPSVIYIPAVSQLLDVVSAPTVAFLTQSIHALPMSERVAVLVTADTPVSLVANVSADKIDARDIAQMTHAERVWRAAMPAFARAWFAGAPSACRVCVSLPTSAQRSAFFAPTLALADSAGRPPSPQAGDAADIVGIELPHALAPLLPPSPSSVADPSPGQTESAEAVRVRVRQLQRALQSVLDVLVGNKLFKRFVNPPSSQRHHDYFQAVSEPMFLTMVALKLRAGKYSQAQQFLADIALIARNAVAYARASSRQADAAASDSDAQHNDDDDDDGGRRVNDARGSVDVTRKYADMLESAAARLVARHVGSQPEAAEPAEKAQAQTGSVHSGSVHSDSSILGQPADSYAPMTPTSGGSDTAPDSELHPHPRLHKQSSSSSRCLSDWSNHGVPQVVVHSRTHTPTKRSLSEVRKQFVSDLMRVSCGFSVEALEALRVRLVASAAGCSVGGGGGCSHPRAAFKEMHKTLKLWHADALRDRCHEGLLEDGFYSDDE
ncbi:TAT-binding protein-like protein 7, AAA ATPase, partial [Coemansia erecta]